ncbi:ASCH domain-containing protein [Paenibacillus chibensis]|nr:ASCH domain-containing protein [Paenibacillus chibensis]MEC0370471.1 ASCH domain-containing protein [Paenibacillus chibensis]
MQEHELSYTMVFGWEGDQGLGEKLIQQIIRGEKTATCAPKEEYSESELQATYEPVGQILKVQDKQGNARCKVRLLEVIETTFGNPDPRLVRGEGNRDDVGQFQEDHRLAWKDLDLELREDTVSIAELFELVKD